MSARDAIYFLAPARTPDGWRVRRVLEHGPYHDRRPATWRGPYATAGDAFAAMSPARKSREEVLADLAQEFTGEAIVVTFDTRADEIVSTYCQACRTESGHGSACPVPVLEAWLRCAS